MGIYASSLWEARDNIAGLNVVALSGTTSTFKKAKSAIKIALDTGVLTDGHTKCWSLLKNGEHANKIFADCSLYGLWSY
jgi:hypothetical protein